MDVSEAPSPEQVAQAKEDYRRALEILMADARATEDREKRPLVGQCFKHIERLREDPARAWPVYVAVTGLDPETGHLLGWHFQQTAAGQIEIGPDTDLKPGFLAAQCVDVARAEFVATFNELLTTIGRFVDQIP